MGHFCQLEAVAFSPDGALIATGDVRGGVVLWAASTGREVGRMPAASVVPPGQIWRLQFTRDGNGLVAAGALGVAGWTFHHYQGIIRLDSAKHLRIESPVEGPVYDLAVHPTDDALVFLDASGKVHVCDMAAGAVPRPLPLEAQTALRGLHFDAQGQVLTYVGKDGSLGIWDWPAGRARTPGPTVFHVALERSGRWAAASSATQGVVLCDVAAGREVLALPSEGADVWSLAWSPDATRVAIGLSDGGMAIWDLERVRATLADFGVALPSTRLAAP
jgi:WD40 repeat protein